MTDKRYNELLSKLPTGNWGMIKEYQIWGNCPTFKNYDTGEILYMVNGHILNAQAAASYLAENYRPPYIPCTPETEFAIMLGNGATLEQAVDRARGFVK